MVFVPTPEFTISNTANVHRAKFSFPCTLQQFLAINRSKQNGRCQHKPVLVLLLCMRFIGKVKAGNDQEMVQSERKSHSTIRGEEK